MRPPGPLQPATDAGDLIKAIERAREAVAAAHAAMDPATLPHWVVMGPGTGDQPGVYLARLWAALPEPRHTGTLLRAATLDQLRELLPAGLTCLLRQPADDPNIIETWI
jgi:hypothetical protein